MKISLNHLRNFVKLPADISSKKIAKVLGFTASKTIRDAVADLREAFDNGLLPNSLEDERYFNIKRMKSLTLQ